MNSTEISPLNYTLNHAVFDNKIQLELHSTFQGIENVLSRKIIDTEEKAIRDSLVQLGWMPPADADALRADAQLLGTRLCAVLWSGALDTQTCGEVQSWTDEYLKELTDAKQRIRELEQAIENLPDVCLDDVPRDTIPTLETIRRIQACRKLLPVK